jgi:hypothetical protein
VYREYFPKEEKMKVRVEVTKNHIQRGRKGNVNYCPIALALKEQLGLRQVRVGGIHITFGPQFGGLSVRLPRQAAKFITAFDEKEPVKPFSFTL